MHCRVEKRRANNTQPLRIIKNKHPPPPSRSWGSFFLWNTLKEIEENISNSRTKTNHREGTMFDGKVYGVRRNEYLLQYMDLLFRSARLVSHFRFVLCLNENLNDVLIAL